MNKFVFIHIPRTAGTTFKKMLNAGKGGADTHELYNMFMRFKGRREFGAFTYNAGFRENRFIHGHTPLAKYYPLLKDSHKFVTWVRDPVERMISMYNWWKARGMGKIGGDYGKDYRKAVILGKMDIIGLCRKMPNTYRIQLGDDLSVFDWIGVQEDFAGSLERFGNKFGITIPEYKSWNVKGKNYKAKLEVEENVKEQMRKYLKGDYKVYHEVLKRIEKQ